MAKKGRVTSWAEEMFDGAFSVEVGRTSPALCIDPKYIPKREHRFDPDRRWRFDFAWPGFMIAVEIEGQGRHNTVDGVRKDCEKYNRAVMLGWRVLRYPATDRNDASLWAREVADMIVGVGVAIPFSPPTQRRSYDCDQRGSNRKRNDR